MTELWFYVLSLSSVALIAALTGWLIPMARLRLMRVMGAIVGNFLAGFFFVRLFSDLTPWSFDICIDSIAAFIIMYHPAVRMQAYIGLTYFLQIAFHVSFGLRRLMGWPADPVFYYDTLTYVALIQLLAVGVWCGGIWWKNILGSVRYRRYARRSWSGISNHEQGQ